MVMMASSVHWGSRAPVERPHAASLPPLVPLSPGGALLRTLTFPLVSQLPAGTHWLSQQVLEITNGM